MPSAPDWNVIRVAAEWIGGIFGVGVAFGVVKRRVHQVEESQKALDARLQQAIADGDRKRAELRAEMESRRAEDRENQNQRFDMISDALLEMRQDIKLLLRGGK